MITCKQKRMDGNFQKRIQRHLYYSSMSDLEKPSFPLTELAVDYFHDSVPDKLGHVDMYTAADVIRKSKVSTASVVLSMMYAKRLRQTNQDYLSSISSSDIFFISVMMASKYLYDEGVEEEVFNDEWADNIDQDVDIVNQMEMTFLNAIDWRLFVSPNDFDNALAAIERRLALREGLKRNWFTYSELDVLLTSDLMTSLWQQTALECTKVVSTLSAVYLTGIFTLLGSTALAVQVSGPLSAATLAMFSLSVQPLPVSHVLTSFDPLQPSKALQESIIGFNNVAGQKMNSIVDFDALGRHDDTHGLKEPPTVDPKPFPEDESHSKSASKQSSFIWSLWVVDSLLTQLLAVTKCKSESSKKSFSTTLREEKFSANELNNSAPGTEPSHHLRYLKFKCRHRCSHRKFKSSVSVTSQPMNSALPNCLTTCFDQSFKTNSQNKDHCIDQVSNSNSNNRIEMTTQPLQQLTRSFDRAPETKQSEHVNCYDNSKSLTDSMTSWFHPSDSNVDFLTHTFSFPPGLNHGIKVT
uniref:Protein CNPPD1 n=1 Tax=Biomphalaria glabrata TaxID=6526 RepID=A0A2C9KAS9_BIOGL